VSLTLMLPEAVERDGRSASLSHQGPRLAAESDFVCMLVSGVLLERLPGTQVRKCISF